VLLTREALLSALPASDAEAICLDSAAELIARQSQRNPGPAATPDNLAYAIFTSGSTGRPNGVLIAHRGLRNVIRALVEAFDNPPGGRFLHLLSFSFDAATGHLFATLCSGATLYLATPDTLSSTPALCRMLRDREITHVGSPVSIWLSTAPEGLPALQTIVTGGEPCPSELVRTWGVERRLLNAYGPTEATICSTMALCADPNRKPHIGRPIANTQIYILDDFLGPVPIGVAGELYIGGMGVARGYLKQPGMTADKFLPDPFSELPGARMYRTGDLARYLPDGNIDFLGRIDHQVKIRGLRIELGEIETILSQHSAVREAVVEAVEYAAGDRRLVAYVVPESGREPASSELRGLLRGKLPQYMVPSAFVVLDTLPLTPNRKVDRAALPRPGRTGQSGASFVAPRTPVQEVLAAVWVQVLGVERVGIHDSFFDLGGHSLLGTQVISRIQDLLKVQLPLRALFEAPTVAELSQVVAATEANPGGLDETVRIPTSRPGMSGKETIEPVQGIAGEGGEH
jgi:amino acid adenylation domain-containing protein